MASSESSPLASLVHAQQRDLSALRAFIDALRAIPATRSTEDVDADVRRAIHATSAWNDDDAADDDAAADDDDGDALEPFTRAIQRLLVRLSTTMKRIDEVETAQQLQEQQQQQPRRLGGDRAPAAPAGLLSLRDYAVLQAALEVFFCWSLLPRVDVGLLLPLDRRRPTKTLEISRHVLAWGSAVSARVEDLDATGHHVVGVTRTMLQVLLLPQIQPILLPKYAVEVVALLVFGETNEHFDAATIHEPCQQMLASLLRVLPLRLGMASVRAALGQSSGRGPLVAAFRKRCGQLLAQLMMEDGGVQATIEMLLGAVDEGNTQARMQVATLICQCPQHVEPIVYAASLARQVRALFDGSNRQNKLLRETAAVLVSEMATRFPTVFDAEFMVPMLKPLLVYDNSGDDPRAATSPASETDIAECVALLHLLLCGPPPSKALVLALVPVVRALVHLYGFAIASKSLLGPPLEETLIAFVKAAPVAATLLQVSVLPVVTPLRPSLAVCDPARTQLMTTAGAPDAGIPWAPLFVFSPGGTGGIAMRVRRRQLIVGDSESDFDDDASTPLRLAIVGLVQLLASTELDSSTVVGELFSSLLLTYMRERKSSLTASEATTNSSETTDGQSNHEALPEYEQLKVPRDGLGLEITLSLLLAIIESLGPSVLRSAETVLQCLTTVLGMFARETPSIVNAHDETPTDPDEQDEDDEVLTVCLGVLMTILEAGASNRSDSEERQLRAMLPVLEELSAYPRPQISELATSARASILSRGASDSQSQPRSEASFEQTFRDATEDLKSPLVPLRARGVVTLTKLVGRSEAHRNDAQWTPRIQQLMAIFIAHLADSESYVFLAAVQGLAALSDAHPDVAIPLLTANLRDKANSLETRIKLSEALLFTAKRCGDMLPKHAKVFVYSYLECIRPPPRPQPAKKPFSLIQEIDPNESAAGSTARQTEDEREAQVVAANTALAEATLRASCLSNLAEVSAMLQWSLAPFAADVLSCVFGILQLELDMSATSVVAVRRGAVFLLKYVLQLMGYKILEVLPDQLKSMYHTLKHVERVDRDDVVRVHAQRALQALDEIMRAELFPQARDDDPLSSLSALRIVKH